MSNITLDEVNQMRRCAFQNKRYRKDVEILLSVCDNSDLPILLSCLATGSSQMENVTYRVVDFKGDDNNTLIVEVQGDVGLVVEEIDNQLGRL